MLFIRVQRQKRKKQQQDKEHDEKNLFKGDRGLSR